VGELRLQPSISVARVAANHKIAKSATNTS
jgi:hypothetical protein